MQSNQISDCPSDVSVACGTATTTKPRASAEGMTKNPRPLSNILPSGGIRPASSVSTQTSANQAQNQARLMVLHSYIFNTGRVLMVNDVLSEMCCADVQIREKKNLFCFSLYEDFSRLLI